MSHGTIYEQAFRITQAIEYDTPDTGPEWRIRDDGPTIGLAEQYAVAHAYLAEHAEDDELPIDPDWMRSVGFSDYCEPDEWCSSYLSVVHEHHARVAVHWRRTGPHFWSAQMFTLPTNATPHTRGELRRLCLSLGVSLSIQKGTETK